MLYEAVTSVVIAVLLGEMLKVLFQAANHEPIRPFHLGGMPSTHAAAVAGLCTGALAETGPSMLLLACVVFGWIVARDAYGVRWEVTKHSFALNSKLKTREFEATGHTRDQVLAGVCLGILVTVLVYAFV
jgi:acid phosphatase family membrane protein YuiD